MSTAERSLFPGRLTRAPPGSSSRPQFVRAEADVTKLGRSSGLATASGAVPSEARSANAKLSSFGCDKLIDLV